MSGRGPKLLLAAVATYLGIGLILASWAVTTWPKGAFVQQPGYYTLVFLQNLLLWPAWLPATVAMSQGSLSH